MQSWFERSRPGRFLNTLGALLVRWMGSLVRPRSPRSGALLPHQWLLAVGTAGMLCVPHALWNNLYGVLFAAVVLMVYWWDCAAGERSPWGIAGLGPGLWVFLLLCFCSAFWAVSPSGALRVALFYAGGFILCYVTAASFADARSVRVLWAAIYTALLLTAVYGLIRYFLRHDIYYFPMGQRQVPRLGSTLEHGINYSEFIAMALPPVLIWSLEQPKRRRTALVLSLLIPCAALGLTYARTGWIALGLALVILLCSYNKKLLIPAAVFALAGVLLLPDTMKVRLLSMLQFNDTGSSGRFTLWRECLAALRQHWLTGVGLGPENFLAAYLPCSTGTLPFQPPHANMGYLEIFLSTGVVGFISFICFYFSVFFRLGKKIRITEESSHKRFLWALTAALAGAALANVPEHLWFYPRVMFFWCVLYGQALALTREDIN